MKKIKISCGNWTDEVEIDENIFDSSESQCIEAMTVSLEKFCEIKGWLEFKLDDFCVAESKSGKAKRGQQFISDIETVLTNAGKLDLLKRIKHDNLQE